MLLPGGTKVENGEVMYLLACVLGFSLERALDSPLSRRLAENNEPCKESCDAGRDRECDQQDRQGRWTLSCDLHPTTSCDADCHYPPPPPTVPWLGTAGTYPSPPPPPPPPDEDLLIAAWIYFAATLFVFVCFLICAVYRTGGYHPQGGNDSRNYIAYWCCCLLPCLVRGTHDDSWDNSEPGARTPSVSIPAVMMK